MNTGKTAVNEKAAEKVVLNLETKPAEKPPVKPQEEDFKVIVKEEIPVVKKPVTEYRIEDEPVVTKNKNVVPAEVTEDIDDFKLMPIKTVADAEKKNVVTNSVQEKEKMYTKPKDSYEPPLQTEQEREIFLKSQERAQKLRNMSYNLKSPDDLSKIENEPAYIRRKVELSDVKPSSESEVSRFSMGEDEEKKPEIKNNPYLHDNVD
jgi:hypothetical protein